MRMSPINVRMIRIARVGGQYADVVSRGQNLLLDFTNRQCDAVLLTRKRERERVVGNSSCKMLCV